MPLATVPSDRYVPNTKQMTEMADGGASASTYEVHVRTYRNKNALVSEKGGICAFRLDSRSSCNTCTHVH